MTERENRDIMPLYNMSSKNTVSADNQQATGQISNEYLAGFVDGEGCFYVGFSKRKDLPLGWQIITEFHLSQNPGGKNILEAFRERLKAGYIKPNNPKNKKDRTWVLVIKNRDEIRNKLIPFFEKHPLFSHNKRKQFHIFKQVFSIIEQKRHLTVEGFEEIASLVFSTPTRGNKKYSKEDLTGASETIRQNSPKGE